MKDLTRVAVMVVNLGFVGYHIFAIYSGFAAWYNFVALPIHLAWGILAARALAIAED